MVGLVLLLAMFAGSGAQKVYKLGNVQRKQFIEVYKMPPKLAQALVLAAGIFELAAVGFIAYGEIKRKKDFSKKGVLALAFFTGLVTLLFKVYPKFKLIQVLSNLSILGGLILLYQCL